MNIRINGEAYNLDKKLTVSDLLEKLGYQDRFVAVAQNQTCIPRSAYATTKVLDNDDIEILAPMSGG